jgi:hypothetical protein
VAVTARSEAELTETVKLIRHAFFAGKKMRSVWRESQFFKGIQAIYAQASVIAEVKVYK